MAQVVSIRFKKASKVYDFDGEGLDLGRGDSVIVEVEKGLGMGTVVEPPREVDPATLGRQLKKVVRKADVVDMERHIFNTERENEAFRICREKIAHYRLPMKLIRVEYLFDSSKAIFYFTSDLRVDFRELVKDLASGFHTRIEMRQIGVRDEAKMIGGLGPCGRELCCAGFLSDFEPVTIKMAKEQNLALNPVKISGICGRLMCCLSYEHEMYRGEKKAKREKELLERSLAQAQACGPDGALLPVAEGLPEGVHGPVAEATPAAGRGCGCSGGGCHSHASGHGQATGDRPGPRPQPEGRRPGGGQRQQGQRPGQRPGRQGQQSGQAGGGQTSPVVQTGQAGQGGQAGQTGSARQPGGQGRSGQGRGRDRDRDRDRRPNAEVRRPAGPSQTDQTVQTVRADAPEPSVEKKAHGNEPGTES